MGSGPPAAIAEDWRVTDVSRFNSQLARSVSAIAPNMNKTKRMDWAPTYVKFSGAPSGKCRKGFCLRPPGPRTPKG